MDLREVGCDPEWQYNEQALAEVIPILINY